MKELGYPFAISKSAMYAIGSPHMWPNLLAALDWLREQIQVSFDLNESSFINFHVFLSHL
jgi:kinetochore protein NDC80